jgi:hypothetical protein
VRLIAIAAGPSVGPSVSPSVGPSVGLGVGGGLGGGRSWAGEVRRVAREAPARMGAPRLRETGARPHLPDTSEKNGGHVG